MEELIKITEKNRKKAVSARELYEKLGYDKSNWTRWYQKNIVNNEFAIENEDWAGFVTMTNGNETKEFALSIDFAKRISMLARTEIGEEVRRYFIDCEKKANSVQNFQIPQTYSKALMLAAKQAEQIEEQQKTISIMAPKAEYFDCLVDRQLNVNFRDTAKELGVKQTDFIRWMTERRYIYRDAKKQIKPYAQFVENGLFVMKEYGNDNHAGVQTLITPKGRETFRMLYAN